MAKKEQKKRTEVNKSITVMFKKLKSNINNATAAKEANVPGANLIFPIIKNVRKNKFNFLIILSNRSYNF